MHNTKRLFIALAMVAALCARVSAATPKAPADKTAAGAKKPAETSPAAPAIAALLSEYQAAMKDGKEESLRGKSDYFNKQKTLGVTAEVILAEIEKSISTDSRADTYVKWQLLSGVDGKFSDALHARAIRAYRSIPAPPPHPGSNHDALQKALNRMGANKPDLETSINKELLEAIDKYKIAVKPFVAYRAEFYSKLSPGYETFEAAFFDLYTRATNGADAYDMWKDLDKSIRAWALKSDEAEHMHLLSVDLAKLYKLVNDDKNKPYYRVIWEKNRYGEGLKWQGEGVAGNTKSMGEIADWLDEHAKSTAATNASAKK